MVSAARTRFAVHTTTRSSNTDIEVRYGAFQKISVRLYGFCGVSLDGTAGLLPWCLSLQYPITRTYPTNPTRSGQS